MESHTETGQGQYRPEAPGTTANIVKLDHLLHVSDEVLIIDRLPLATEHFDLLWTKHPRFGHRNLS